MTVSTRNTRKKLQLPRKAVLKRWFRSQISLHNPLNLLSIKDASPWMFIPYDYSMDGKWERGGSWCGGIEEDGAGIAWGSPPPAPAEVSAEAKEDGAGYRGA